MAAILACRAMLNHRPLRRGCLIEFLYPTGVPGRWRRASPRPRFAFLNESSSAPDAASPHLTTSSSSLHFSDAWRRPPRCSGRRPRCRRGTAWVAGECSPRGPAVREPCGGASVAVLHASHSPLPERIPGDRPVWLHALHSLQLAPDGPMVEQQSATHEGNPRPAGRPGRSFGAEATLSGVR
jgi:hypothetical protein